VFQDFAVALISGVVQISLVSSEPGMSAQVSREAANEAASPICDDIATYLRDSPLNELARSKPSHVMSRYSISA
jgi:hypothetical protein